ncbi:MAG TPA: zf-TFIIB domain-containing protein [Candidatus Hydrogenedentes bacterium]|nr:zf-TFIIB domain-containing protein [Candidatus Hydrogenedentota bacterium]
MQSYVVDGRWPWGLWRFVNCPACEEPMMALEYDAVEVDYCGACGGVWLDAGELELLLGARENVTAFMRGGAIRPEKPRRCPICGVKMVKEATSGEPAVTYDSCPSGDGLWFDRGELDQVLARSRPEADGECVAAFLREIFGRASDGMRKENGT